MDEFSFEEFINFPRGLSDTGITNLVNFIHKNTSNIKFESNKNYSNYPAGFIVGNYPQGIAYLFAIFGKSIENKDIYGTVSLRADTPWKNRRDLTLKLRGEIKDSIEGFFKDAHPAVL